MTERGRRDPEGEGPRGQGPGHEHDGGPGRGVPTEPGPGAPHMGDRPADPESGIPDAMGAVATARPPEPPEAAAPPPPEAPAWAVALSVVLPGAGHLATGWLVRGVAFLLSWGALLGVLWLGWETVFGPPAALDEWVAVLSLVGALLLVWGLALRHLLAVRSHAAAVAEGTAADGRAGDSQWAIAARHFRRNGLAMAGLVVVVLLYLVAVLAPLIAPFDPIAQGNLVRDAYMAPGAEHWLGTDQFARDMMSRIIYGARISLAIGLIAVVIAIVLGSLLGAVAGYLGGKLDAALMRFTDMVMAFPRLVLLIMIIALFDPSITLIILVLGLTQWPGTARLVRGEVLSLREQEYIQAARALGFGRSRIILRHLIPNVLAPVIVAATLGIGNTIVLEAGLSFLGLGVQPPTPSWGTLVADGRQNLIGAWWVATFPGLAIVVTVLAFNLVGDGLRDALDPRLRS
jgi:peptide/nickel transport system permease protein